MAVLILLVIYGIVVGVFIAKKKMKMSQALLPMMAFAIVSSVALGQNYLMAIIPEMNDGIGISNFLAEFLLPGDGWSKEMFFRHFEMYLSCSVVLIFLYTVVVFVENLTRKVN